MAIETFKDKDKDKARNRISTDYRLILPFFSGVNFYEALKAKKRMTSMK